MKPIALAALLSLAALAGPAAAVDFTGPYAPANWTIASTGTLIGSGVTAGSATFTSTQLTLVGGNSAGGCAGGVYGFPGPCRIQTSIGLAGTYTFHWSYTTADADGPAGDIFGVLVDATRIALSDPGGPITQSGDRTFTAASSFGWFLDCTDCTGGTATAMVSRFAVTQPIPEPSTYALMLAGLAALGTMAQRHRKSARRRG